MSDIPQKWRDLFQLLPGYDPVATAGDCVFDAVTADRCCNFFPQILTHVEGEKGGQPLTLEPWQQALIGCAFGWKRPDGRRRYKKVLLYVPRKNGKTTLLAGLMLLVALCDGEPGAQIYSAAADREQAALLYRQAKGMIENSPDLQKQTQIYVTTKTIQFPRGTFYRALSAAKTGKHGYNSHFVVVDELHEQPSDELVNTLWTSTGARRQPMLWFITTADYDRPSCCNAERDYAIKVRDGIIDDPSYLPVLYEASVEDNWEDPAVWRKANPNLGVSVSEEYLAAEAKKAREVPSYLNTFLRLHLNVTTAQDVAWIAMDKWDACLEGMPNLGGESCFAGLDLSATTDLTAFVMVFPREDGKIAVVPKFWMPKDKAFERQQRDRVPYQAWASRGLLTLIPGAVIDYDIIRRDIKQFGSQYNIQKIAVDRWNATQISQQLIADGFDVGGWGQGFASMTGPSKELEALIASRKLIHGGHEILRWMASNVMVEIDAAGNIKPTKSKQTQRIDGIVALIMGLGVMAVDKPAPVIDYYETHALEMA